MKENPKIVIIGSGPCGIGAGWHLFKNGYNNWVIYEKNAYPGGLSASFKDAKGFTWDIGGHVLFSHYKEFSGFLEEVLEKKYLVHNRNSWVRAIESWIPYPFQNNIHYLPQKEFEECFKGLEERSCGICKVSNFQEWIETNFGKGISKYFMISMNQKMWSYPLDKMSTQWIDERISPVSLEAIRQNMKGNKIDSSWGPNSTFIYPFFGGIGEVFRRAVVKFRDKVRLENQVYKIDLDSKKIFFKNGMEDKFDILVNTSNLIDFINILYPQNPSIVKASKRLKYNRLFIVGIGLRRERKDPRTWIYFSEEKYIFYRVTNLSNYSPYNVPNGHMQSYSSLLTEITLSENAPANRKFFIEETVKGLIDTGMLSKADESLIESIFSLEVENAYPIPTVDRDEVLYKINEFLESQNIYSRGRFGSFKYERGNMDDCFMQGFEIAHRMVI